MFIRAKKAIAFTCHPLESNWRGCRKLHIEPNWLLT
ncbi:hypothetical protein [Bartonella japonica]